MLARCSACRQTFRVDDFGPQRCPGCGVEVVVREPVLTAESSALPAGDPAAQAPGESAPEGLIPWERRRELGFFRALGQTLKRSLFEPEQFFRSMRYDRADGALLYFSLVVAVPQVLGLVLGRLLSASLAQDLASMLALLHSAAGSLPVDPRAVHAVTMLVQAMDSRTLFAEELVSAVAGTYLQLFLLAGIAHLVLMAFGQAKNGWTATFKAFAYSYSTGILAVVSSFGMFVALLWASVLQVVGLRHAHQTATKYAVWAVAGWQITILVTCVGAPAIVGVLWLTHAMKTHAMGF